jgi:hypothetical protein
VGGKVNKVGSKLLRGPEEGTGLSDTAGFPRAAARGKGSNTGHRGDCSGAQP